MNEDTRLTPEEMAALKRGIADALAGRVRGPVAAYLPGAWLPHCVLASGKPADAFAVLHPVEPVRARIVGVEARNTLRRWAKVKDRASARDTGSPSSSAEAG